MFGSFFRQAQQQVENTITSALLRAAVTVPFIIALGFGFAAGAVKLCETYGTPMGLVMMAGIFLIIGSITAAVMSVTSNRPAATATGAAPGASIPHEDAKEEAPASTQTEKELLFAALTSAAPMALPTILRLVVRNLPLILILGAAAFILTRKPGLASTGDEQGVRLDTNVMAQPAE